MRYRIPACVALAAFSLSIVPTPGAENVKDAPKLPAQGQKEIDKEKSRNEKLGGKNFDEWKKDLTSTDPAVVENALRTIIYYRDIAQGLALDVILAKLKPSKFPYLDTSIKVNVLIAIREIGVDSANMDDAAAGLCRALNDEQAIVRFHAALTLESLGHLAGKVNHGQAIDRLRLKMKDQSTWEVRKACARALASVATPNDGKFADAGVVNDLRDRARIDSCFQVRLEALQSLLVLGPPQGTPTERASFTDSLKAIAKRDSFVHNYKREKEDKTVRIWADVAIIRMDRSTIEDKEKYARDHARRLERIGKLLEDPILGVRCQACRALGQMQYYSKSQVDKLSVALDDKDPIMVGWTVWALANIGPAAKKAIPALKKLADTTRDPGFRAYVLSVIKHIDTSKEMPVLKNVPKPPKEELKINKKRRIDN